jgi:hypothetical protein
VIQVLAFVKSIYPVFNISAIFIIGMKEITDASEINKQFRTAPKNFRGRPYGRNQNYKENWYKHQGQRGRGYKWPLFVKVQFSLSTI